MTLKNTSCHFLPYKLPELTGYTKNATPFLQACIKGDVETLRSMLENGVSLSTEDYKRGLEYASVLHHTQASLFLIEEGLYQPQGLIEAFNYATYNNDVVLAQHILGEAEDRGDLISRVRSSILAELENGNIAPVFNRWKCACALGIAPQITDDLSETLEDLLPGFKEGKPIHILQQMGGHGLDRWVAVARLTPPLQLEDESPYGFKIKAYKELFSLLGEKAKEEGNTDARACGQAYRLCVLMGSKAEAVKYLERWTKKDTGDKQPIHDACLFDLPKNGLWDIPAWRGLCMKYGPEMAKMLRAAPEIEEKLGRLPKSLSEARHTAAQFIYENAYKHPSLATVCHELGMPEYEFDACLRAAKDNAKTRDSMPDVYVDGAEFGKPNYYMTKLSAADPRGLLLGEFTNCCQSVGGYGEPETKYGFSADDAGFYVVMQRGEKDKPHKIVAQCFAWIKDKTLVFDSWERLSDAYDPLCEPFLKAAAEQALEQGFEKVNLGKGGNTPKLALANDVRPPKGPLGFVGELADSRKQYTLAERRSG